MASSPPRPIGAGEGRHDGSEASGPIEQVRGFHKPDDSSSITLISSVSRPAACSICKEPESKPTKPLIRCQGCKRSYHPCCPHPPVLNKDWMDENFKYYCAYWKCKEKLAANADTTSPPASKSTTPSKSRTSNIQQRATNSHNSTPYDLSSANLGSPGAFRDSKKTREISHCEEEGCQVPLFRPIQSKERLCTKHGIEKKSREAKARALLAKPVPPKAINKNKLHHLRPEDRQILKRKRASSGRVPSSPSSIGPDQFTPVNPKERSKGIGTMMSASTPVAHPPMHNPEATQSLVVRNEIGDVGNNFHRVSRPASPNMSRETKNSSQSLKTPQPAGVTQDKLTPSPDYEPPPPEVGGNGTIWSRDPVFSELLGPRIVKELGLPRTVNELRLGASENSTLQSVSTSTSASVGQSPTMGNTTLQDLPQNSAATDSDYSPPTPSQYCQSFVEDDQLLDPNMRAYIDEIAATHPDSLSQIKKTKESAFNHQNRSTGLLIEVMSSHDSDIEMDLGVDASFQIDLAKQNSVPGVSDLTNSPELAQNILTLDQEVFESEVDGNSQLDAENDVEPVMETNETAITQMSLDSDDETVQSHSEYFKIFAPASPSLLLLQAEHENRAAKIDLSDLDEYMKRQADPLLEQEGIDQHFIDSQIWVACDPRKVWPKAQPDKFWEEKRKEIAARPRRKANFGELLTDKMKRERLEKGWDVHQTRERDFYEESEIARHYEGIFGAPFWDDCDTLHPLDSAAKDDASIDVDVIRDPGGTKKKLS